MTQDELRKEFEAQFPVPKDVQWNDVYAAYFHGRISPMPSGVCEYSEREGIEMTYLSSLGGAHRSTLWESM